MFVGVFNYFFRDPYNHFLRAHRKGFLGGEGGGLRTLSLSSYDREKSCISLTLHRSSGFIPRIRRAVEASPKGKPNCFFWVFFFPLVQLVLSVVNYHPSPFLQDTSTSVRLSAGTELKIHYLQKQKKGF